MIALPFNDRRCLGSIGEVLVGLVENRDPLIVELAERVGTIDGLLAYIRALPQRDDLGEKGDGPKVEACDPPQRLRVPAEDPNCVERAAMYIAVAELIDPHPIRQLATLDTKIGLHTFPLENGAPVILDPRLPRNSLDAGIACQKDGPIETAYAIEWTTQLAEVAAAPYRNGPSRVRRARNALVQLVEHGIPPDDEETFDSIGWMLALAERVARKYGQQALAIVRHTAMAIAEVADEALARTQRNIALEVGGMRLEPAPWVSMLARIAGRVGMDVGAVALRTKLASMGIGDDMIGLVEEELNREGLSLGELAKPRRLPTLANLTGKSAA